MHFEVCGQIMPSLSQVEKGLSGIGLRTRNIVVSLKFAVILTDIMAVLGFVDFPETFLK